MISSFEKHTLACNILNVRYFFFTCHRYSHLKTFFSPIQKIIIMKTSFIFYDKGAMENKYQGWIDKRLSH